MAAKRQLLAAIKPPKPISEMTAAEKRQFVNEVVQQIAHNAKRTGEGQ